MSEQLSPEAKITQAACRYALQSERYDAKIIRKLQQGQKTAAAAVFAAAESVSAILQRYGLEIEPVQTGYLDRLTYRVEPKKANGDKNVSFIFGGDTVTVVSASEAFDRREVSVESMSREVAMTAFADFLDLTLGGR